ncbi:nonstructural protein 1 [Galliform chaphamaparvovirus 9]|nr:nonstructural protein 1 [Galliform chaphamaparvovirus 9]
MAGSDTSIGLLLWLGSRGTAKDLDRHQAQALIIEKDFVATPEPELTKALKNYNMKQWVCCVIQICKANADPIFDPLAYCLFLNELHTATDWAASGEFNKDNVFHVHCMIRTTSRADATKRSMETIMSKLKLADNWIALFDQDTTIDCCKIQSCVKPESMLAYLMKDPAWVCSNSERLLQCLYDINIWGFNKRFQTKPEATETELNLITKELIDIIRQGACKTIADVMRTNPETMAKYLHRPGLSSIIANCLTYCEATAGEWNIGLFDKYDPNPEPIHRCLLHQGIEPSIFDPIFHAWINKTDSKRNTLILYGPSNTGKTAFISGLKACVPWGEIINSNSFNFEGLIGQCIGVWEEPYIGVETAEKFKQIAEGMTCAIPVKYKKPHMLHRTPIIITTNHHIWRFCTAEEDMFRNRSWIFEWNHPCKDTPYTPRVSEHGCKCRYCTGSRRCSSPYGESESGPVQRAKQPLPTGEHGTIWSEHPAADVCTRPLRGTGEGTSGSDDSTSRCGGSSAAISSTDSTRSAISTSTSTIQQLGREQSRSRDPDYGVPSTSALTRKLLVAYRLRHGDGDDSDGARPDSSRESNRRGNDRAARSDPTQSSIVSYVEPMGHTSKKAETISVSAKKRRVDRVLSASMTKTNLPMYVPLKQDWAEYLSYLHHYYG